MAWEGNFRRFHGAWPQQGTGLLREMRHVTAAYMARRRPEQGPCLPQEPSLQHKANSVEFFKYQPQSMRSGSASHTSTMSKMSSLGTSLLSGRITCS